MEAETLFFFCSVTAHIVLLGELNVIDLQKCFGGQFVLFVDFKVVEVARSDPV